MNIDRETLKTLTQLAKDALAITEDVLERGPEDAGMSQEEYDRAVWEYEKHEELLRNLVHQLEEDEREEKKRHRRRQVVVGHLAVGNSLWGLISQFLTDEQVREIYCSIQRSWLEEYDEQIDEDGLFPALNSFEEDLRQIGEEIENNQHRMIYG